MQHRKTWRPVFLVLHPVPVIITGEAQVKMSIKRSDGSYKWHQPCQRCKSTTSVDIKKRAIKKLVTHVESYASAVSLLESGK